MEKIGKDQEQLGNKTRTFTPGYKYLLAWKITVPIYDYTVEFCNRCSTYNPNPPHFPHLSSPRTLDQMIQAARSGTTNIPEGNTQDSTEGYLKLTGVNRGSLEELLNDVIAYARQNKIEIWGRDKSVREIGEIGKIWEIIKKTPTLPDSPNFPDLPNDPTVAVNLLITLINQANYLQSRLKQGVEKKFVETGGFREGLYRKRREYKENKGNRERLGVKTKTLIFLIFSLFSLPLSFYLFSSPIRAANSGTFTLSLWVNPTTSVATKALISKAEEFRVFTNANGYVGCQIKTTTWQTAAQSTTKNLILNTWNSVICTYDLTKLTVYVNGVQVAQTALTSLPDDTAAVLRLGQDDSASTTYTNLAGTIDEFKFYNYALTVDEVKTEYNRGSSLVMGNLGTSSTAPFAPLNSSSASFCVPGDNSACSAPVAEWNFEEGSGLTAADTSGNSNTGTLGIGDSAPIRTSGKIGKGLKFDGSNDYVDFGDNGSFKFGATTNFSVEFWFKTSTTSPSSSAVMVSKYKEGGTKMTFYCALNPTTNYPDFSIYDGTNNPHALGSTALNNGVWHHFTGVRNVTDDKLYLYIDGVLVGNSNDTTTTTIDDTTKMIIGGLWNPSQTGLSTNTKLTGSIDQVRIFNYARTPAQIAWDYNQGKPVAHWRMNECSGTAIHDSSGNNNTGTLNLGSLGQTSAGTCTTNANTAWYNGASGKYSSGLNFDGQDDYVDVTNSSTLNISNQFSISGWIYWTGTNFNYNPIFSRWNAGGNTGYGLNINGSAKVRLDSYNSGGGPCNGNTTILANTWYHVVGTVDSNKAGKIYINGKLDNSSCTLSTFPGDSGTGGRIGDDSSLANRKWKGLLDDVRIYNYPLTAVQVKTLYNESSSVRFGL